MPPTRHAFFMDLRVVSLFSGAGGLDLGLEQAGYEVRAQVERDKDCRGVLRRHWPTTLLLEDVKDALPLLRNEFKGCGVVCGGDPCPVRSKAKMGRASTHPDLSGYFLAVAAGLRPRWVVRENVLAPDVTDFECALDVLGYRSVIIQADAEPFTAQSRRREFLIGCTDPAWPGFAGDHCATQQCQRNFEKKPLAAGAAPCLSCKLYRYNVYEGYVFEGGRLRLFDPDERATLAGFPAGWFEGVSPSAVARMCGNAVVSCVAKRLGAIMMEFDRRRYDGGSRRKR